MPSSSPRLGFALPARIPCHEARGRWHCALDPWRLHFALDPRGSRHGCGLHSVARTQESPAAGLSCERLAPERFRDVNDFYKANGYKATCRPTDILWVLREPSNDALVAAVRLTPQRYKPCGAILFLRSLCVARDWRRRGLGTVLTRAATAEDHGLPRYCFALEELVPLYLRAGWRLTPFAAMPLTILSRFEAVVQQTARKHKKVALLSHGLPAGLFAEDTGASALAENAQGSSHIEQPPTLQTGADRVRIVLLQHANEVPRPTSTGAVLEHESLRPHLNLERWVWRGRSDNAIITDLLASHLKKKNACVLVWAEAPGTAAGGSETAITAMNTTYIILDGTWQEARAIFRKCPCLHSLPRVALPAASTAFVLRGNFGWRHKFGRGSVGGSGSGSGGGGGDGGGGGGGGGGAEGGDKEGESNGLWEREGRAVLYLHMHMYIPIDVCVYTCICMCV